MLGLGEEVHVWRAALDEPGWPSPDRLPAEDRERARGMSEAEPARRWVAARWALRGVLGHYLERDPAQIALALGPRGKPALGGAEAALRFNLSHSGAVALIAVAHEREVGIDVERIEPRRDVLALAARALDEEAAAAVREAPPERRLAAFHNAWVRHEATVKCLGSGLGAQAPPTATTAIELDAGRGYAAAVATTGERQPPLRRFAITARLRTQALDPDRPTPPDGPVET